MDSESGLGGELGLVHGRLTLSDIARVVGRATGIPVQSLLKGEKGKLIRVRFTPFLSIPLILLTKSCNVDGRSPPDTSSRPSSHRIRHLRRSAHVSGRAPKPFETSPVPSFLFLGPTGMAKTEIAKALASFLFNDERKGL